jgi:hypothetical protein
MPRNKHRRAALAGLGATGSLLAATAAAALVVGGLLGFGAFPGAARDAAIAPLRVAPAPAGATARAPIAAARVPQRTSRRALRHPAGARTVQAPRHHRRLSVVPHVPAHGVRAVPPAAAAPAGPASAPSGRAPTSPAPASGPLAPAAHAVRDASASASTAVAPVPAPVAAPVESAGAAAAGAVEQADHTVAATLGALGR